MCYFEYRNHLFEINSSITKHFILQAQLIFMYVDWVKYERILLIMQCKVEVTTLCSVTRESKNASSYYDTVQLKENTYSS